MYLITKPTLSSLRTILIGCIAVTVVMHLSLVGGSYLFGWQHDNVLVRLFNVDNEYNVPTTLSAILLLWISSIALVLRQTGPRKQRRAWLLVATLFTYMALDELLVIHERISLPVREYLNIGFDSPLYHAWIIPAAIAGFVALWSVYRLSQSLPRIWRLHLIELLVLYAVGVIAFEMIGTLLFDNQAVYYSLVVLGEELFELSLQAIILYVLYSHIPQPNTTSST